MLDIEKEKYMPLVINTFMDNANYSMLSLFSAIWSFDTLVIADGQLDSIDHTSWRLICV